MNTLHNTILAEKLDEVAKIYGYYNWDAARSHGIMAPTHEIQYKAALLAMEEVSKFYEWLIEKIATGVYLIDNEGNYRPLDNLQKVFTTEELYQIYKEENI